MGASDNKAGGTLQAGRDLSLIAGRDVNIGAAPTETAKAQGANTQSSITQLGSSVSVGRDLMALSGRDINVVASDIDAKRDIAMAATENMTISSAADETHSLSRSKKLTVQTDHVKQVSSDLNAGGSIALNAGKDLAVISSRITAGENANLSAGENLSLLAAQDSDYYLYDKKSKGSWGKKKTKRDEVTDIRNVGSEITSGGDLTLESGGNQLYQVAKLTSGNDLTIESGGGITFEGVKDFHDESHTKSKSSLAWNSMKGKGRTDETLRQTEMVAKGELTIQAVEGLRIDIKQVDQQTVSQTIDAMVQADPQLAWLKEAEKRGDVDWRQVKEIHESFKYSHSSLGGAAQMIIAIIVAYFTAGAASGLIGAGAMSGSGTAMAAATTSQAMAAGASYVGAGWDNVALTAVATSAASGATVSAINNRGNLGAVLKDVTSADALRGYVVSGVTAGLTAGVYDKLTSTQTGTSGVLQNSGKVISSGGLSSWGGVGSFAANQLLQNTTSTLIDRALGGDSQFGDALSSSLVNTFAAAGFNWVGGFSKTNQLADGSLAKIGLHAVMGGLAAEAAGGDFKTGALAAGVNEALVDTLAKQYADMSKEQRDKLLVMNSQAIGVLTASVQGGDAKSLQTGSWVAANATTYNRLLHATERKALNDEAKALEKRLGKPSSSISWDDFLLLASSAELDAAESARLQAVLASFKEGNPEQSRFKAELSIAMESIQHLASQNTVLMWSDGKPIVANGAPVYAFQSTDRQFRDSGLLNTDSGKQTNSADSIVDVVPFALIQQLGEKNATAYWTELSKASTSPVELDELVGRVSNVLIGGIDRVTWDLDLAFALTGGPGVLRALLAKRVSVSGGAKVAASKNANATSMLTDSEAAVLVERNVIEGTAKGSAPKVAAEGNVGGQTFQDVNQTSRPLNEADPKIPSLIADRIADKASTNPGKLYPNGNMKDAHAEIGVIQQAYSSGKTTGADMFLTVAGKDVCGFCKGDIAAAAEKAELKSLTVSAIDDKTGLPKNYYWESGMKSIKEKK
ncbi:DUF637 domain-containing protein [Pseudomonas cichorii]|nr:DUF637 domain-containing protein [Pseudomonas cichorii]